MKDGLVRKNTMISKDDEQLSSAQHNIQDLSKRSGYGVYTPEELEGVKDEDSYRKWRRMIQLPILNEQRKIKCSDESTVDLAWFPAYLEERFKHLPQAEQELIKKRKHIYQTTHLLAIKLKSKAYGKNQVVGNRNRQKEIGFLKSKRAEILELFGKMFTVEEVHKIVVEEWNFPASRPDIINFKLFHLAAIEKKIEIHKSTYSDLRLVQKRSRIEELTGLYNKMRDKIAVTTNREDIKVMTTVLAEIRKEVEGEKLTISGGLDLKIEADINVHLQKEVFKEFSLTQIIIGRVASRMNTSSSRIIQGLQNSYYARYNRFLGNEPEDVDFEEIEYPSQQGYDFERIKVEHRDKEITAAKEKTALKVSEAEIGVKVAQSGFKETLLRKLSEKTGIVKSEKLKVSEAELKRLRDEEKEKKSKLKG